MERDFLGLARNSLIIAALEKTRPFSGSFSPDRGIAIFDDGHPPAPDNQMIQPQPQTRRPPRTSHPAQREIVIYSPITDEETNQ